MELRETTVIETQDGNPRETVIEGKSRNCYIIICRGRRHMLTERSQIQKNTLCGLLHVKFKKEWN